MSFQLLESWVLIERFLSKEDIHAWFRWMEYRYEGKHKNLNYGRPVSKNVMNRLIGGRGTGHRFKPLRRKFQNGGRWG